MGTFAHFRDRLTNVLSGMGTSVDKRTANFYSFVPLSGQEAESGYRSSWLIRKIIDVPPFDMTREWRDWQADSAAIEKLEAEERRLQLKAKCQRALVLARLFGGSALILGTADRNSEQEISPDAVRSGGLRYIQVLSRHQLTEGAARCDPADPWFGQPEMFTLTGANGQQVRIHPSRVVAFIGQKTPEGGFYPMASWFWGDPIMQSIGEAVKNADLAQSGFAALIDRAAVDVFKFKDLMGTVGTEEGEAQIQARAAWAVQTSSAYRAKLIDTEDDWQQVQATWAGIPEAMDAFLRVVAGAADIPVTRLLGQSPKGMQSTGDGEERDYHAMVQARQHEMLGPALDRVDDLLIRSALGSRPSDVYWEFAPLAGLSEKDAADLELKVAQTIKTYSDTALLPDEALTAIAKNRIVESGRWPGSETAFEEAEANAAAEPDHNNRLNESDVPSIEKQLPALKTAAANDCRDAVPGDFGLIEKS